MEGRAKYKIIWNHKMLISVVNTNSSMNDKLFGVTTITIYHWVCVCVCVSEVLPSRQGLHFLLDYRQAGEGRSDTEGCHSWEKRRREKERFGYKVQKCTCTCRHMNRVYANPHTHTHTHTPSNSHDWHIFGCSKLVTTKKPILKETKTMIILIAHIHIHTHTHTRTHAHTHTHTTN